MRNRPPLSPEVGSISGRFLVSADDAAIVVPGKAPCVDDSDPSYVMELCSDVPPFDADPNECVHPLAHAERGPAVVFVRTVRREPTETKKKEVLRRILPFPILALRPEDRPEWEGRARREAVSETGSETKILSVLVDGRRVVVPERTPDVRLVSFLSNLLGTALRLAPLLWERPGDGRSLLLAAVDRAVELRKKAQVDRDFTVEEARVRVGKSTLSGPIPKTVDAFDALLRRNPSADPSVDSVILSYRLSNGRVVMKVDEEGPYRIDLPNGGGGGLPADRARRRSDDLTRVLESVGKELRDALSAVSAGSG